MAKPDRRAIRRIGPGNGRPRSWTPEQFDTVLALALDGHGRNEIARLSSVPAVTVSRIIYSEGVAPVWDRAKAQRLHDLAREFDTTAQLEFVNRAAARADDMLTEPLTAKELQSVVTAGAIAIDKRRLITGEVTQRTEHVTLIIPDNGRLGPVYDATLSDNQRVQRTPGAALLTTGDALPVDALTRQTEVLPVERQ